MTVTALDTYRRKKIGGSEAIAWAAGLFEGEGSFYGDGPRIRASLVSTDEDVVRRFAEVVGVGVVYTPYDPRTLKAGRRRLPSWKWEVSTAHEYRQVFEVFAPYLGARRLARGTELWAGRLAYIALQTAERPCVVCGAAVRPGWYGGRTRIYCGHACACKAYRQRQRAKQGATATT